jgi:hypothetical protein
LRIEAAEVGNTILDLRRTVNYMATQQDAFNSQLLNIFSEIRYLRSTGNPDMVLRLMDLTRTIMHLLGNRADVLLLEDVPRAWTIPGSMEYAATGDSIPSSSQAGKLATRAATTVHSDHDLAKSRTWVRDTNEVLQALELPLLAEPEQEAGTAMNGVLVDRTAVPGISQPTASTAPATHSPATSSQRAAKPSRMRKAFSSKSSSAFSLMATLIRGFDVASRVLAAAAMMLQTSLQLSSNMYNAPKAFARIANRLEDLAPLLEDVANLIATGEDLHGGRMILDRAVSLHHDIKYILYKAPSSKRVASAAIRWIFKDNAESLVSEIQSVKLTLSCTLQANAVRLQIENHQKLMEGMSRVGLLERNVQMLQTSVQARGGTGQQPNE